jgi:hypothetical protein
MLAEKRDHLSVELSIETGTVETRRVGASRCVNRRFTDGLFG